MAYYPDLTEYCYHESGVRPGTQNVGWLDAPHPFPTGNIPDAFLQRLWLYCKVPVVQTRGFHICDFCQMPSNAVPCFDLEGETLKFGSAEIRVFGNSVIYASPNMIFHYVRDHSYLPPQPFVEAVFAEPGPDSQEYRDRLKALSFLK